MTTATPRWFWPAVAALLAAMCLLMVTSIRLESQTYDEGFHITAGASYWMKGDYRLNPEHPPLAKLLCAIPVVLMGATFPNLPEAWANGDQVTYFGYFVYRNKLDADELLFAARSVTILLTLILGLAITVYARRRYSPIAAIVALALFVTDPNLIAHGRYITTDVPVTLFMFLAILAWMRALETDRYRDYAIAGIVLGLALGAKFSALFLLGAHALTMIWKRRVRLAPIAITVGTTLAVIGLLYAPATWQVRSSGRLAMRIPSNFPLAAAAHQVADDFDIPAHPFLTGLWDVVSHNHEGHRNYLNGNVNTEGDWKYFPIAFLVKTPTATILLGLAGIVLARWPLWTLYPTIYIALSVSSNLNIGIRHLLPIYPFLFLLAGAGISAQISRRLTILALLACSALQLYEVGRVYPDFLAFFNAPAGGPEKGDQYLLDSNLDWGQDAKKLSQWMKQQNLPELCISYFGTASLEYYGIRQIPLLNLEPGVTPDTLSCVVAISVNNLHDLYTPPQTHAWARRLRPFGNIGHSIRLFDLRKPHK